MDHGGAAVAQLCGGASCALNGRGVEIGQTLRFAGVRGDMVDAGEQAIIEAIGRSRVKGLLGGAPMIVLSTSSASSAHVSFALGARMIVLAPSEGTTMLA